MWRLVFHHTRMERRKQCVSKHDIAVQPTPQLLLQTSWITYPAYARQTLPSGGHSGETAYLLKYLVEEGRI